MPVTVDKAKHARILVVDHHHEGLVIIHDPSLQPVSDDLLRHCLESLEHLFPTADETSVQHRDAELVEAMHVLPVKLHTLLTFDHRDLVGVLEQVPGSPHSILGIDVVAVGVASVQPDEVGGVERIHARRLVQEVGFAQRDDVVLRVVSLGVPPSSQGVVSAILFAVHYLLHPVSVAEVGQILQPQFHHPGLLGVGTAHASYGFGGLGVDEGDDVGAQLHDLGQVLQVLAVFTFVARPVLAPYVEQSRDHGEVGGSKIL